MKSRILMTLALCLSVFAAKAVSIFNNVPVCTGATMQLSGSPAPGTWTSSNTSIATVSSGGGLVTGVSAGTVTITYTQTGGGGGTATAIVTVHQTPTAIIGDTYMCYGNTYPLSDAVTGGTWSLNNTGYATIDVTTGVVTPSYHPNTESSPTVTYKIAGLCSVTKVITIRAAAPLIDPNGTANGTVCSGATTTLPSTGACTWSSGNTSIATVAPQSGAVYNGIVTGVSAGTATISYSTAYCSSTYIVTVNGAVITGNGKVCVGLTTTLSNASSGGTWSASNGNATVGSASGIVTGVSAGTTTISYTATSGCVTTSVVTVSNTSPAAITGTATVCVGATTTLSNSTGGGTWSSGNTGIATVGSSTGIVTGIAAGSVNITYAIANGCIATKSVTVNTTPGAISGTTSVSVGGSTTLGNTEAGGTWSSSNTGIATVGSSSGILTGVAPGTAYITYTLSGGCYTTALVTVNLAAITGQASVCIGYTTTLANATAGGTWSSDNTGIATINSSTGLVTGVSAGTANITYTYSGFTATVIVTVNLNPDAITGTKSACRTATTTLSDATSGGTWSSSNTAIATVGSATGVVTMVGLVPATATYSTATITYTLGTGCYATTEVTVNADGGPITINTQGIENTHDFCIGESNTLNFQGAAPFAGAPPYWTTSNASIIDIPNSGQPSTILAVAEGTATISFTPGNGCYSTYTIDVHPAPGEITTETTFPACYTSPATTVTFSNSESGGTWEGLPNTVINFLNPSVGNGYVAGTGSGIVKYFTYNNRVGCVATLNVSATTCGGRGSHNNSFDKMQNGLSYSIAPNPGNGYFELTQNVAEDAVIPATVINCLGKVVYENLISFSAGQGTLDLKHISSGIYILRLKDSNGTTQTHKIVIE